MYLLITFNNLLTTVIRRRNTSSVMQLLMITRTLFNNTSKKGKFINKINVQTFCCNDHYVIVYSIELKKTLPNVRYASDLYTISMKKTKKKKREISITNESKIHSLKSNYRTDFTILFLHPRGGDYELHGCRVSKGPTSVQKWRE